MSILPNALQSAAPLQTIATQLTAAAPVTAPGQVTPQQQAILDQKQAQAQSTWGQFMHSLHMSAVAANPDQAISNLMQVTEAQWSVEDTQVGLRALGLASQDYNEYLKIQAEQKSQTMKLLFTAGAIAGSIISGGTLAPVLLSSAAIYDSTPG